MLVACFALGLIVMWLAALLVLPFGEKVAMSWLFFVIVSVASLIWLRTYATFLSNLNRHIAGYATGELFDSRDHARLIRCRPARTRGCHLSPQMH